MYGRILHQKGDMQSAKTVLLKALEIMPILWTAWLELASILKHEPETTLDSLPKHWVRNFHIGNFKLEKSPKESFEYSRALLA